jgi:hypothetical protein
MVIFWKNCFAFSGGIADFWKNVLRKIMASGEAKPSRRTLRNFVAHPNCGFRAMVINDSERS